MKHSQPLVSVVIPVLNEANFIQQCLDAVLSQDYPHKNLQILVIDGGSTDSTRQIVQTKYPTVRLLDNPHKIQASAMNIGILATEAEIIIRVDGHTLIAPDYVQRCVHYLQQDKAQNVGGLMRSRGVTFVGQGIALATGSPFGIGGSKFHYATQRQYVDTVYMGAFWRKVLIDVGLYDETFQINEDYELNYRLRQAGGKILLSPDIISTYTPRSSMGALWRQYFQYGRWKVRTLQKHPDSLKWRQAIAPLFVAILAAGFFLGLLWKPFRWLFALASGAYLLANFLASTIAARKGGWQYLPVLPVVFAAIHFAWGSGFWYGLAQIFIKKR